MISSSVSMSMSRRDLSSLLCAFEYERKSGETANKTLGHILRGPGFRGIALQSTEDSFELAAKAHIAGLEINHEIVS